MARRTYLAALVALLVSLVAACGGGSKSTSSTTPAATAAAQSNSSPTASASTASITPEALWAAALTPAEVQQLASNLGEQWLAGFPEFYGPPFNLDAPSAAYAGDRFWVHQQFDKVGTPATSLDIFLHLYPDASSASASFTKMQAPDPKMPETVVQGPAVADQQRYSTRTDASYAPVSNVATVLALVGPVTLRLSVDTSTGFATTDTLARYATAVVTKVKLLVAGQLPAPTLPQDLTSLMPPTLASVGPVLATAAVAPEAWGVVTTGSADSAAKVAASLRSGGTTQLGFRRYALAADHDQVLDITLIPRKDAISAAAAVASYGEQVAAGGKAKYTVLDPGKTGLTPVYALHDELYELQFSAGRYYADVTCASPFGDVSKACEAPVRQVAEAWYTVLQAAK